MFEELIFGGAYIRRGLLYGGKSAFPNRLGKPYCVLLCFSLYLMANFQVQAPGGLYSFWRGHLMEGILLPLWGTYSWRALYMGGGGGVAYFRNFTASQMGWKTQLSLKLNLRLCPVVLG